MNRERWNYARIVGVTALVIIGIMSFLNYRSHLQTNDEIKTLKTQLATLQAQQPAGIVQIVLTAGDAKSVSDLMKTALPALNGLRVTSIGVK